MFKENITITFLLIAGQNKLLEQMSILFLQLKLTIKVEYLSKWFCTEKI